MPNFTTGPATLPDVGELSYNGCVFSPLFETQVSGVFVKDAANRTTKEIEYTITADGYVTLPEGHESVESTLHTLERLLSQHAGALVYRGRGVAIAVNAAGTEKDVAWGPVPEILDIVPMGGGRSAKIRWTVKTRVPPRVPRGNTQPLGPVLQFSYDSVVTYDEAGYSKLALNGIMEIPLTRNRVNHRGPFRTADDFRDTFPERLLQTFDLQRYRITNREFHVSKDLRTMEFSVVAEEHPWMVSPPDCTLARGQFTFKPAKTGVGLCNWLCTLTATYTVPKPRPRRVMWLAFLALLRERMRMGNVHGVVPPPPGPQNTGLAVALLTPAPAIIANATSAIQAWRARTTPAPQQPNRKVWLVDFSGTEGLYLESKTTTFSATWRLVTTFSSILLASGLWKKVPNCDENAWSVSLANVSGTSSWLPNRLASISNVIVDFGT